MRVFERLRERKREEARKVAQIKRSNFIAGADTRGLISSCTYQYQLLLFMGIL